MYFYFLHSLHSDIPICMWAILVSLFLEFYCTTDVAMSRFNYLL
ncbi:hypothetical protein SERP2466 [Staphylococcus epidermidis RP62A]|uniref:Uncharacterized protein n=1 Tax=Staphylococcus epidermidis (strain ATCC 35984 / DSM 28319 / BCRC 17069 / CCUG 31568 / BM 3577 / RP62A) TaxID=176279 RepID=Q5HK84_STAEQ|nr:hypothetical protein SERP2466 [Staphylococcus epidermidis RP62A]